MQRMLAIIYFGLALCSCTYNGSQNNNYLIKDSIINEYVEHTVFLAHINSKNIFLDSSSEDSKILNAYHYNNLNYLFDVRDNIKRSKEYINANKESFIEQHNLDLRKMDVDEVYQFNYSKTFCPFDYYFTISKNGNMFNLHSTIYEVKKNNKDSLFVEVANEFDKSLTANDWGKFDSLINYSDYWGLNSRVEQSILDPSSLAAIGIIRNPIDHIIKRTKCVTRLAPENTALYSVYTFLEKLSGYKKTCSK